MKKNIKKFENFEHNDNQELEYNLIREINNSVEYKNFRQHYTQEIRTILTDNNDKFTMTHQISNNIITDVIEMIKKIGYNITKK